MKRSIRRGFLSREVGADVEILHFARDLAGSRLVNRLMPRYAGLSGKHVDQVRQRCCDGEMILIR